MPTRTLILHSVTNKCEIKNRLRFLDFGNTVLLKFKMRLLIAVYDQIPIKLRIESFYGHEVIFQLGKIIPKTDL